MSVDPLPIERGVPIPDAGRLNRQIMASLERLEPGDSFTLSMSDMVWWRFGHDLGAAAESAGIVITTRPDASRVRVWRVR